MDNKKNSNTKHNSKMKIAFRNTKIGPERLAKIKVINKIIGEYQRMGYKMTLRQLYYQLVSRDIIANKLREYANLSGLLTDARMCGLTDWDAIEDRLRIPSTPNSWDDAEEGLETIIDLFELPRMREQKVCIEVWVEKDALSGVLKRVTRKFHIPILVNRGYSSASAMFDAYNRFKKAREEKHKVRILYLGDYDPSGMDMIRDVEHRILEFFIGRQADLLESKGKSEDAKILRKLEPELHRQVLFNSGYLDFQVIPIALTREQIDQYQPPPNPAKMSDPRANKFVGEHGETSWEVDALPPEVLDQILTDAIEGLIDMEKYREVMSLEEAETDRLRDLRQYLTPEDE
jgi:hypothetical protein